MSPKAKKILIIMVVVLLALGGAVVAGRSGGGPINVNHKIRTADQSQFAAPVQTNTQATLPNGGLRGMGKAQTEPEAQPPAPPAASSSPQGEDEAATTTPETQEAAE